MKGDPHHLLALSRMKPEALMWPGKLVLVIKNERNGMKIILVVNDDGTPHEVPRGMEDEAVDLCAEFVTPEAVAGL